MPTPDELEAATAAMVALAEANIPADIQELLVHGDPAQGIAPYAILSAIRNGAKLLNRTP